MKRVIFTISILVFKALNIFAQKEATTKDGKKVILYEDGTWKYAEMANEEKDISLDCADLISTETDKVTGVTSTASKGNNLIISSDKKSGYIISIILLKNNSLAFWFQLFGNIGCIEKGDNMNVLFRDGTRILLGNCTDFNCKGQFILYLGGIWGMEEELEMFRTKEVETIRIHNSDSFIEEDFTSSQSKRFMKSVDCLLNYSKNDK